MVKFSEKHVQDLRADPYLCHILFDDTEREREREREREMNV